MTLSWSNTNDWADSSGDLPRWTGLNDFGAQVVREMNRLGMMIDISHASDETFLDVIRLTRAPVIASHSSCRALCDHARNMSDEMIRALAANGGVIQINFYSRFVDQRFKDAALVGERAAADEVAALGARFLDRPNALFDAIWDVHGRVDATVERPPLSSVIAHIDHVVKLVGPDHVGLGSDFDGVTSLPLDLDDESRMPAITEALLARGYAEADVRKILGGNLLRVMEAVERVARGD